MVTVCAWCQKYMGSREPLDSHELTHGICDDCREREHLHAGGVLLVVSRARAGHVGRLRSWLRGAPVTAIVLDRRTADRRHRPDGPPPPTADRRSAERRRARGLLVV
jgi:hypothetical protein